MIPTDISLGMSLVMFLYWASRQLFNFGPEGHVVSRQRLYKEYDFIIIGGGSAGAVLANRLSEMSDWNVLLLEARGDETVFTDIPLAVQDFQLSRFDWRFQTTPQNPRACLAFNNYRCNWPRGKVLGGSSVLNYMVYMRGNRLDYDNWAAQGNTGWSYDDVLPYFKKSEDLKAFLRPVRERPNLHVSMETYVLKILFDSNNRAYGVQFQRNNVIMEVFASKEVVLSAGAISSPQILMLSGIGHEDHLTQMGINVVADLPVGDNLQDHITHGGMVFQIDYPFSLITSRFFNAHVFMNYTLRGAGPLTSIGGIEGTAFVKTKYADPNVDWPDIQFMFVSGSPVSDPDNIRANDNVRQDVWNEYYAPIANTDTWQVVPTLLRPLSRGTIRLQSMDPFAKPLIDPQYFSNIRDLDVLVEGVKTAMALSKTGGFQNLGTKFYDKPFPGCESFTLWTDPYWQCFTRQYSLTLYHPAGTCKMIKSSWSQK